MTTRLGLNLKIRMKFLFNIIYNNNSTLHLGPSNSGKTWLIRDLIENADRVLSIPPVECYFFYGCDQPIYADIKTIIPIHFVEGVPIWSELPKDKKPRLLIIDDGMSSLASNSEVADIFTKYSHHFNYSILIVTQNLFLQGKYFRTISLNCQYLFLLNSIRDTGTIKTLSTQMGLGKFLFECYEDAMKSKFGHLFLNLRPESDINTRVRTNFFGIPSTVYLRKK